MPASSSTPSVSKPRSRVWYWLFITLAAATIVISVKAVGVFFLSSDARKLQLAVNTGGDDVFSTRIQFSVGPGIIGLARTASFFIDDVPSEARQVLGALEKASVGIYELAQSPSHEERAAMMERANVKLRRDGWQRIVAVNDGADSVMVFLPDAEDIVDEMRVCVTVWTEKEVVVVSATVSPEDLLEIARNHEGFLERAIPELARRQA